MAPNWIGDELAQRDDFVVRISDSEAAEITGALRKAGNAELESIGRESFPLPKLANRFAGVQHALEHGSGVVLIRGVPVAGLPEDEARRMFWGLTRHLGTPTSQSAGGERIFSVRDAGFADNDPRSRGPMTRKGLTFHSDRCDVIAFLCLQQAKEGGENEVVSSVALRDALAEERPDLLRVLQQPFLYQRHNVDLGNENPFYEQPVFSEYQGRFASFLMQVLIERAYAADGTPDMTGLQREALDYLQQRAAELAYRFRQQPGDLVLMNNLVTLHRRGEFVDHEEPEKKRHLLRIWLSVPNSRPLDPAFAPTFGETAAGAIRGGMKSGAGL